MKGFTFRMRLYRVSAGWTRGPSPSGRLDLTDGPLVRTAHLRLRAIPEAASAVLGSQHPWCNCDMTLEDRELVDAMIAAYAQWLDVPPEEETSPLAFDVTFTPVDVDGPR